MAVSETDATDTLMEGERRLLSGALAGNASSARLLFSRYAAPVYFLLLHLSGCSRDAAYEKTVSLLAGELSSRKSENAEFFLIECLRAATAAARALPVCAAFDDQTGDRSTPERAVSRHFVKEALEHLSFEDKALLLLRDQLNLPYAVIARVHGVEEREARVRVERARLSLREALEVIFRNKEGAP